MEYIDCIDNDLNNISNEGDENINMIEKYEDKTPCENCLDKYIQCEICIGFFKLEYFLNTHEIICKKLKLEYKDRGDVLKCFNCKNTIVKTNFPKHLSKCKANIISINCSICNKSIPKELIEKHEKLCLELKNKKLEVESTVECLFCKGKIPLINLQSHERECEKLINNKNQIDLKIKNLKLEDDIYPTDWIYKNEYTLKDQFGCKIQSTWLVPINKNSEKFKEAEKMFYEGFSLVDYPVDIVGIEEIQNLNIYRSFHFEEKFLLEKKKTDYILKKDLFYNKFYYCHDQEIISIIGNGIPASKESLSNSALFVTNLKSIFDFVKTEIKNKRYKRSDLEQISFVVILCEVIIGQYYVNYHGGCTKLNYGYDLNFDINQEINKIYSSYDSITDMENYNKDISITQTYGVFDRSRILPKFKIEFSFTSN